MYSATERQPEAVLTLLRMGLCLWVEASRAGPKFGSVGSTSIHRALPIASRRSACTRAKMSSRETVSRLSSTQRYTKPHCCEPVLIHHMHRTVVPEGNSGNCEKPGKTLQTFQLNWSLRTHPIVSSLSRDRRNL